MAVFPVQRYIFVYIYQVMQTHLYMHSLYVHDKYIKCMYTHACVCMHVCVCACLCACVCLRERERERERERGGERERESANIGLIGEFTSSSSCAYNISIF